MNFQYKDLKVFVFLKNKPLNNQLCHLTISIKRGISTNQVHYLETVQRYDCYRLTSDARVFFK